MDGGRESSLASAKSELDHKMEMHRNVTFFTGYPSSSRTLHTERIASL